jgi:hypothetical protein
VLGPRQVDAWFGSGTSVKVWALTKQLAGYRYANGLANGLGFSLNQQGATPLVPHGLMQSRSSFQRRVDARRR